MKKLMTLAALVAACAPAFTAEVTSSNTVGYQKIAIPQNSMDIIGVQFQKVGGGAQSAQDLIPEGYSAYGTDWIMVYDHATSAYTKAYYWGAAADGGVYESADAEEPLGPGWGDGNQNVLDIDLADGRGFWTQAVAGGTLLVAGEVATDAITIPKNSMTIVTSTYPGALSIQDIVPTGYSDYGTDWIMVYDRTTSTYTKAYYWGAAADGGVYESADAEEPIGPGWGDGNQNVINITLSAGQGFWTQCVTGGSLAFPSAD